MPVNRELFEFDDLGAVSQYLEELSAAGGLSAAPLPSPDLIWWRAQLAEKRRQARRSVLAIDAVRFAAVVVSAAFVALLTILWAPRLFAALPLPLPLTLASLILFACSTGGVLLLWSRQR